MLGPRTPQMRTVPVNKSIPIERPVATYDDIRAFVETIPGPFAVIPCICRQGRALTGQPCHQTSEPRNCLMFGAAATMMTQRGIARPVSKPEMLDFLDQADRQGLVLQPQNTLNPLFVCCCCGCCCCAAAGSTSQRSVAAQAALRPIRFIHLPFHRELPTTAAG